MDKNLIELTLPNGCQHCGKDKRTHSIVHNENAGWHNWTAPTNDQRKTRMKQRRAKETI